MKTPTFPEAASTLAEPAGEMESLTRRIEQAEAELAALRKERDQAFRAIADLRNETFFLEDGLRARAEAPSTA